MVLLVDDKATDREVVRAILEDSGYQVREACSGAEAIALASERHHGLILMDIKMPGMDGLETLEQIRRIDPQVKAIFVSGYTLEPPVLQGLRAGAYAAVVKPVDPDELLELIKSITATPAAECLAEQAI